MAEHSKIEWTDHTFNPWTGCTKVSPGCDGCYAEAWSKRSGTVRWGTGEPRRRTTPANWKLPLKWNAQAAREGRRYRVFCASLADVFDNDVPVHWRHDLFRLILDTPHLTWLLLTKRISNVSKMLQHDQWEHLGNVWLGATVVNQAEADRDIPKLLAVPARVRFLSIEPMLGPIDLTEHLWGRAEPCAECPRDADCACGFARRREITGEPALHWVIAGGESGPYARPSHPDWYRSLRDQCAAAGVPFLFKQWGEWCPRGPESMGYSSVDGVPRVRLTDAGQNGQDLACRGGNDVWMNRAGKKAAGRLLDGVEHDGYPLSQAMS